MARAKFTNRESNSMRSLSDCKYFINGQCWSGEACQYRHSLVAKNQLGLCFRWPDHCRNINCRFRHPISPTQSKETTSNPRKGTPISFFWDIESVPIPKRQDPFDIVERIRRRLVVECDTKEVSFSCLGNINLISNENQRSLKHANVSLDHVPDQKAGAAVRQILLELDRFERNQRPPATVVLISGDINFIGKLSDLRHQAGFYVIVIHNTVASKELKATVNAHYSWDLFTNEQASSLTRTSSSNNNQRASNSNSRQRTGALSLKKSQSGPSMSGSKTNDNLPHGNTFTSLTTSPYPIQESTTNSFHYQQMDPIPISVPIIDQSTFPVYYHNNTNNGPQYPSHTPVFPYGLPPSYSSIYNSSPPEPIILSRSQQTNNSVDHRKKEQGYVFQNCPSCGDEFENMQALQQHQEDECHLFVCQMCNQAFYLQDSLKQHQRAKHSSRPTVQRNIPKVYSNNRSRVNHGHSNSNNLTLVNPTTSVDTDSDNTAELVSIIGRGIVSLTRELFK